MIENPIEDLTKGLKDHTLPTFLLFIIFRKDCVTLSFKLFDRHGNFIYMEYHI